MIDLRETLSQLIDYKYLCSCRVDRPMCIGGLRTRFEIRLGSLVDTTCSPGPEILHVFLRSRDVIDQTRVK